ncbi:MAG: glycosyltransferase family 4 protein [Ardenticatenia bacterium]|nr:glycosyltransferase family 4 protein [Ardenticatenia bacterium]
MMPPRQAHIGFVSTRLASTDGVSLETAKWVKVLTSMGYECFFFTGESEWPADRTMLVAEAHFKHPEIRRINADLFDDYRRSAGTSLRIRAIKEHLKAHLYQFVRRFQVDLLVAENVLSLPMNVPLGLALAEFIAETGVPTIGHHHDFWWERRRYAVSAAHDYLRAAFPPTLRAVRHVVINSFAGHQLALQTGAGYTVIPNVMDFEMPLPPVDEYARTVRSHMGLADGEYFLLQPTRIVPRKHIERAIELARRLELPCALVISHASGDEGDAYALYLREYADLLGVRLIFASDSVDTRRGRRPDGAPVYDLADMYRQADLVTYPSDIEGFGNAFLETVYYRRPIVMNTYEIFKADIQPKGFKVIGFDGFVDEQCVARARAILENPSLAEEMVNHNFEVGRRHYSFETLESHLVSLLYECLGAHT